MFFKGVPGIANRLFGALKNANISVMFIAQASSEHSICFATKEIYGEGILFGLYSVHTFLLFIKNIAFYLSIKSCQNSGRRGFFLRAEA